MHCLVSLGHTDVGNGMECVGLSLQIERRSSNGGRLFRANSEECRMDCGGATRGVFSLNVWGSYSGPASHNGSTARPKWKEPPIMEVSKLEVRKWFENHVKRRPCSLKLASKTKSVMESSRMPTHLTQPSVCSSDKCRRVNCIAKFRE